MKNTLRRAMLDSETFVIEMVYADAKGNRTRRMVSPIRFVGADRFLALCLCREEPRQFYLSRCSEVRLIPAAEVIMPMPMEAISDTSTSNATSPVVPVTVGAAGSDNGVGCLV